MSTPLEFSIDLAQQAGAYLMDAFSLSGTVASRKPDRSFVTQADVAVDNLITNAIHAHYPGEAVLSEELHTSLSESSPAVWIIDPLDGTTNFSLGLHVWGVLITRVKDGWPETSVLYFPRLNELYTAQRGQGAQLNGSPIHTRLPDPQQPFGFFSCCSRTHHRYNITVPYKPRILGSAAYSFCMLARGTALISFESTPKIWDIAGAWLMVEEAGGSFTHLEGDAPFPLAAGQEFSRSNFPTIGAATPAMLETARTQIVPKRQAREAIKI
ncbi:MAG TPA: inositol monophosphatase family protein [Anaerolineales bacterium]|nr:inositol monophosphatase family protein [Anaerolineales bacterium]